MRLVGPFSAGGKRDSRHAFLRVVGTKHESLLRRSIVPHKAAMQMTTKALSLTGLHRRNFQAFSAAKISSMADNVSVSESKVALITGGGEPRRMTFHDNTVALIVHQLPAWA